MERQKVQPKRGLRLREQAMKTGPLSGMHFLQNSYCVPNQLCYIPRSV